MFQAAKWSIAGGFVLHVLEAEYVGDPSYPHRGADMLEVGPVYLWKKLSGATARE